MIRFQGQAELDGPKESIDKQYSIRVRQKLMIVNLDLR